MIQKFRTLTPVRRVLMSVVAIGLILALAVGMGAMAAAVLGGGLGSFFGVAGESPPAGTQESAPPRTNGAEPPPAGVQESAPPLMNEGEPSTAGAQEYAPPLINEGEYLSRVEDIQSRSVEAFLASNDNVLRYETLDAAKVEQMRDNYLALKDYSNEVANLDPPEEYAEQHEVFGLAVSNLYSAAELAYTSAALPSSVNQEHLDAYTLHVNRAAAYLRQSNAILGQDYQTLEGVKQPQL